MTAYKTGSLVLALIMAFIVGMAVSLIYAFLTITMMANQNVTGLTLTISAQVFQTSSASR